jgi:septation ring formation regulator EzrA
MARIIKVVPVVATSWSQQTYQGALRNAERELAEIETRLEALRNEQRTAEQRAQRLRDTITAIRPLANDEAGDAGAAAGLTEACSSVLGEEFSTVPEIKKRLEALGFDIGRYDNPHAVLHTTLDRMYVAGHAEKVKSAKNHKTMYREKK